MAETCNLRGEVLRLVKTDPKRALERFEGLMERSITRAKKLRPLPALNRNYNFATAVIGDSEAALNSAMILAGSGLDVFLFGSKTNSFSEDLAYPNVHSFKNATVKSISGTLGEFQLSVETGGYDQKIQVGTVILGEKSRSRIPYIHQEELPSRTVASTLQKSGITGVPFFAPGATSIKGLYLADPPGVNMSKRNKGAGAAIIAAALMPRGPRQSKGFTVSINEELCRGCGRCISVCPYQAITLHQNHIGGWFASVDEVLCKGCGNCISNCPSNAADSPYRDQFFLEQSLEEILSH
jgi:heterodisulfide reductase subunit A-like polyferredoxin